MPQVGQILSEKYRLVRLLGEGGMGSVYEARHDVIGKRLAIKFVHEAHAASEEVVARFVREARAAAAIGHPGIIDIYDASMTDDGIVYLVMEYLEGESFAGLLERDRAISVEAAAYVACQTLSALDAAHRAGIVHRDLKPDNIFLVKSGRSLPEVKLLDFGISKVMNPLDPRDRMTKTGVIMGTPFYMAPEQARGERDVDHQADLYAMGVILYEAVTGTVPFKADNVYALVQQILTESVVLPRRHVASIPEAFEEVILTAMAREREDRYPSAAGMLEALLPFVAPDARPLLMLSEQIEVATDRPSRDWTGPGPRPSRVKVEADRSATGTGRTSLARPVTGKASISTVPSRAPRRWGLIAFIAATVVVALAGAVAGVAVLGRGEPGGGTASAAIEGPGPAKAVPDAAAPPERVTVRFEGLPEGARVYLDDAIVPGTSIEAPRSAEPRSVRIECDGYEPWREAIRFEQGGAIRVSLRPSPAADAGAQSGPARHVKAGRQPDAGPAAPPSKATTPPFGGQFDAGASPSFGSRFE